MGTICHNAYVVYSSGCEQNNLTTSVLGNSPSDCYLPIAELPIQRQTQNPLLQFLKLYFSRAPFQSPFNKIIKCNLTFTTKKFVTS